MINARSHPHANITEAGAAGPIGEGSPYQPTSPSKTAPIFGPQQAETARYIAAMSAEMATMANAFGLKLVAHFLAMAQAEAEEAAERAA
jgi:hypothetical protein